MKNICMHNKNSIGFMFSDCHKNPDVRNMHFINNPPSKILDQGFPTFSWPKITVKT